MIDLSVRRPVATAALYVALLALGVYSFRLIPLELLPEVEYPRVTVRATWPGASPEATEARVTAPLESAVQRVEGVRSVRSVTRADPRGTGSSARVEVTFDRDARMEFARLDLRERIAALRGELPEGVRPAVEPYVPEEFAEAHRPLLQYRLRGPYEARRLAELAREEVRPTLAALSGVAGVDVRGGSRRVVEVVLDPTRLEALGLTPEDVRARLARLGELRAPGAVEMDGRRTTLSLRTRTGDLAGLRGLVVAARSRATVRLDDVARVRDTTAEPTAYRRIDGQPAVTISVRRSPRTNALDVADRVRTEAGELAAELPGPVTLELDFDQSEDIRAQLTDLRLRAVAAAAVIFLVLVLFLRAVGPVLVVFGTIAFSVLVAVNLLYLGGFSLNVLTLAGLAWGFGLVVDNAIVVLENVERRREAGEAAEGAAREGARQMALPVVAATATTAVVLLPFLLLQGELRAYYVPLGFAVGFSILGSLFVAFTFVPSMGARLRWRGAASGEGRDDPAEAAGGRAPLYERAYRAVLEGALDHPVVVLVLCVGALAGSWWLFDQHVRRGVRWTDYFGRESRILVTVEFPRGAGLERTDELVRSFERKIATVPEVRRYETTVRPQYGRIRITFPDSLERTPVPVSVKERMVAYSHRFSGAEVRVLGLGPSFYGGGGRLPNYQLDVLGFSYLKVREVARDLAGRLEGFTRIRDVDPNASRHYRDEKAFEYYLRPDRRRLAAAGLSVEELLGHVSASLPGPAAGRLYLGGKEVPYALKLEGYRRFDFLDLRDLRVPAAGRREVRVGDVAEVGRRDVLARIVREDQRYRRTVAWQFRGPRKLGDVVRDAVVENTGLPPGYEIEVEDRFRLSEEEKAQVWFAIGAAVLLVFMVTAALFESLAAPLVILLTLPLSLIGVFLIFFYTDATFTRTAYIGAIMMGGIVVNNAILVVYHIGELREEAGPRQAVVRGTLERVRPILMTTLTTVLGLLPLVLFVSSQDENIWNALALATIGGLVSSTVFVLTALPVAYRWLVARGAADAAGGAGPSSA